MQVGDVVQLEADEQVPTDLLLLGSSDEFLRCQINTANLDGETNLKVHFVRVRKKYGECGESRIT